MGFSFVTFLLAAVIASAGSKSPITYQGRILTPDGRPLNAIVNFRFVIRSPTNCVLWAEDQTIDMRFASGAFSARIGEGTNLATGTHGFSGVFTNATTWGSLSECDIGSTYTPGINDDRTLVASFNDGNGSQTLPTMAIKSVPFAAESNSTMALRGTKLSPTAPVNGEVLRYDSVQDQWVPSTLSAGGSVLNVGLSMPSLFSVAGGPVTTTGTFAVTLASQSQNHVFAAPVGSSGTPSFRALDNADIPALAASKISSGTLSSAVGGTGLVPSVGDANKIYGVNAAGNGNEYKVFTAGTNVVISYGTAGDITINATVPAPPTSVTSVTAGSGLAGGTITSTGTISLPTTSVVAGSYGGVSWIPNFVVDAYGRLTSAGSTSIALDASAIVSGTLATAQLGVVPGAYGGTVTNVDTGAGLVGGPFSTSGTISLGTTGVASGSYGSATYIPTLVVDQYGRLTSAGSVAVNSSQWVDVALGINYGTGGSVGIGVAAPVVKLDVAGAIKIANDAATCVAGLAGSIRYTGGMVQYCDGSTPGWVTLGVSGSGLQFLNGLNANSQTFAMDSAGTIAAITSAGTTHTFSIPMASTSNAVGGLISNADYLLLMNGTIPASRVSLGTSGVAAGSYGGASWIPNFSVDSFGRVTSVGSTAISLNGSAITSGTLSLASIGTIPVTQVVGAGTLNSAVMAVTAGNGLDGGTITNNGTIFLGTTAVGVGSYGSSTHVPTFTVDQHGRLTAAGSVAVASSGGTVQEVVAGAGLSGGTISTFGTISLPTTGVAAGSTGTSSYIPTFIVDAFGRLTGRGSVAVAIDASAITSGTLSLATVGTIPVSQVVGAGTLNSAVMSVTAGTGLDGGTITNNGTIALGTSGVAAGSYGSSTHIPTLGIDAYGRVTTAGSVAVNSSQWTNVALGINYGSGGSVGIGVASPVVKLDIDGAIKIANDSATCAAGFAGAIRYNGGMIQYCDGLTAGWVTLGVSGSGLQSLNGLLGNIQTFAINTSGTIAAITSAGTTHTFSVPMASTTNAVGGLISNSDYLTLMNGTIPVSRVSGAGTLNSAVMAVTAGNGLTGGTITNNGTIELGTSGVAAGNYGGASYVGNYSVDQYGRITSAGSTAIAIDANQINSGTINNAQLGTTGVIAGSFGSSTHVATFTVDQHGRLTAAGSVALASSGGTVQEVVAGAGLSGGTISTFGTISLPTTGVAAGSTGTASYIPTFIVDAFGRLTGRGSVAVAIDASAITSGTLSLATVGTIPVSRVVGAGTLNSAVMAVTAGTGLTGGTITDNGTIALGTTGVSAGTFGSSTHIPTLGIDAYGRVTSAGSIAVNSSQWTNVALGINYATGGSVGIGVAAPAVKLDIDGAIKIANESATCAAGFAGAIRYSGGVLQYCDGSTPGWLTLGVSGSGLQNLNGLNGNIQTFAMNSSGTIAAIVSAGTTHTFSVPMATTTGAVGGLISNSDYLLLMNGTIPVSRVSGAGTLNSAVLAVTAGTGLTGGTITNNGTISLGTSGVAAGSYGGASWIPNFAVDAFGRLTSAGSTNIAIDATQITSGTLNNAQLGTTGVSVGSYGSSTHVATFTVDQHGRLTAAGSVAVASSGGTVQQIIATNGLTGGTIGVNGTIGLSTVMTAGTFSSAAYIPQIGYDIYGRIVSMGSTALSMAGISGTLGTAQGGTGLNASSAANGQLLIGNGSGFTLGTLNNSNGIVITNSAGTISVATNAQTTNATLSIVSRDANGSFAANKGTFNSVDFNNAGSLVTLSNPAGAAYSMMLPQNMGTPGQVLSTNGTSSTSWTTVPTNGGTFLAASGSVGTPGFSFTSDPDTGLYNPGANQLAFSTNGVNRLNIGAAGNIGLGTVASSSYSFDNYNLLDNTMNVTSGSLYAGIRMQNGSGAIGSLTTAYNHVEVGSDSNSLMLLKTNNLYRLRIEADGRVGIGNNITSLSQLGVDGNLAVGTYATTAAAPTNGLIVSGSVGIGTSVPLALLDVNGSFRSGSHVIAGAGTVTMLPPLSGTTSVRFPSSAGSAGQVLLTDGTGNLSWSTPGGSTQWTTASGNIHFATGSVGIGTSTLTNRLTVNGGLDFANQSDVIRINGNRVLDVRASNNGFVATNSNHSSLSSATGNFFAGSGAGNGISSGGYNVGIGQDAGSSISTGGSNVMIGAFAGSNNTSGGGNIAIGQETFNGNTNGNYNTVVGFYAMNGFAQGNNNAVFGQNSGGRSSNGNGTLNNNTIFGTNAGFNMAGGSDNNILVGYNAGSNISTGDGNLMVGYGIQTPTATTNNFMSIGNLIYSPLVDGTGTTHSTGSVGIGTASPLARLDVSGSLRSTSSVLAGGGTVTMLPPVSGTTSIRFPASAGTSGQVLTTDGTGNLSWTTASGGGSGPWATSGSLVYTMGGTVGIGTSTVLDEKLNVASGIVVDAGDANPGQVGGGLRFGASSGEGIASKRNAGGNTLGLDFYTAFINRLAITQNGFIGINTNSPTVGAQLEINGTGTLGSSVIIPRDTTANRPSVGVNGMMRYNTTTNKFEAYENGSWENIVKSGVVANATALSNLQVSFASKNFVRASGTGACTTIDISPTGLSAGQTYSVTIPGATTTCTNVYYNGGTANRKLPQGYTGGLVVSGVVYTFLWDGTDLWVTAVNFQ